MNPKPIVFSQYLKPMFLTEMGSAYINRFDIFDIYRRYCEITSTSYADGIDGYRPEYTSEKAKVCREALAQLLKLVESRMHERMSIFEEVSKLMSRLELMADSCELSRFYNFVFFICRENCQRSITVARSIMAWRLVLSGRFRLLNQWCNFVEENQPHNISEDTWQQVLAFTRCVHENLEGYDPYGAWPVLIDEFVEHMYRIMGSSDTSNLCCNCGDSEAQLINDSLPGLKIQPGVKRKLNKDLEERDFGFLYESLNADSIMNGKRRQTDFATKLRLWGENNTHDCMDIVNHSNNNRSSPLCCSKSPCAVDGCLSKGFAGLFSVPSCFQFDRIRRAS